MIGNDYCDIAYNDLLYLQATLHSGLYNQIAVQAEQVAEEMLKSVAERYCVGVEKLLKTHNLHAIYDEIHKELPDFELERYRLSTLKDLYFDAKYPGDNFVIVDGECCTECLEIMYTTIEAVHCARQKLGLQCKKYEVRMLQQNTTQEIKAF